MTASQGVTSSEQQGASSAQALAPKDAKSPCVCVCVQAIRHASEAVNKFAVFSRRFVLCEQPHVRKHEIGREDTP